MSLSCLIYGAKQIVQIVKNREKYVRGGTDQIKSLSVLYENLERGPLIIVSIEYAFYDLNLKKLHFPTVIHINFILQWYHTLCRL